jgi:hypothetical protein
MNRLVFHTLASSALLLTLAACQERSGSVPEVPEEEMVSQVPELDAVHDVMVPLWHEAFPARDTEAILGAIPEFETLLADLDTAELPGILQDKAPRWNEQKTLLLESFQGLKEAAESGSEEGILAFAEALHMNYEGLVRIIRPLVPELDVFHRHLYGLYHYYGPGYDLEKIARSADAMAESIPPLQEATLPDRLSSRQADFDTAVAEMGTRVAALQAALENPSREGITTAINEVHEAYSEVEAIFD